MHASTLHIHAIVINYFCFAQTIELLHQFEKLQSNNNIRLSVTCADNSNNTQEQRELEAFQQQSRLELRLLFNQKNLGFGRAINAAAQDISFDYLWLVNPDVTLFPCAFDKLLSAATIAPMQGIWGGVTVTAKQQADHRHAWREPNLWSTAGWAFGLSKVIRAHGWWHDHYQYDARHNLTQSYPVDSVTGCCLLIRKELWDKLNGFDDEFFLYSEETDLCRRARRAGFQPTIVPTARLLHSSIGSKGNWQRLTLIYHAKLLYAAKHHDLLYCLCFRFILLSGGLIRGLPQLAKGNTKLAKAWLTIAIDAIHLSSRSIKKRYAEQR
ncbi:MAG: glycosyltransferase family 2 protein [Arenicella sp.]|nr:glycosyltransferase family 2 protein [Arenicella sp.]